MRASVRKVRVQGDDLATRACGEAVVGRPRGTIIIGRTATIIIGALAPVNAIRCRTHTDATWLRCGWRRTTNVWRDTLSRNLLCKVIPLF